MYSTKTGNDWCFDMKVHVGDYAVSGLVHSLKTTIAKSGTNSCSAQIRRCGSTRAMSARGRRHRQVLGLHAEGIAPHPIDEDYNPIVTIARVEHPFRVTKRKFRYL